MGICHDAMLRKSLGDKANDWSSAMGTLTVDWKRHIGTDPQIMHGTACFRGTRVQVSVVLDNIGGGLR
ncbi:MAG: DUF433 domain-containing protein [Betaproteobacteria bacterium]|nr:DUF433 domain-containing protein [Betaproteobacteria bacterium]